MLAASRIEYSEVYCMVESDSIVPLFCTVPIIWIISALIARYILILRGYNRSDSWVPGCVLGPFGVILSLLTPQESPLTRRFLQVAVRIFTISLFATLVISLVHSSTIGAFTMLLCAIVCFLTYKLILKSGQRFTAINPTPVENTLKNQVWIQNVDYSVKEYPYVDPTETLRLYRLHDWASELAMGEEMRQNQEDFCPPGMGLSRDDGRLQHILPDGVGHILVDYRSPNLPRSEQNDSSTGMPSPFVELPESTLAGAIEAFHAGDDDWFQANLS
jgi:hypothetical protein